MILDDEQDLEIRIEISELDNIQKAISEAKKLSELAGFSHLKQFMIALAVSELARNIYLYAPRGEIVLRITERDFQMCMEIVARDEGPGIEDIKMAMTDLYSTSWSLGLGLPSAERVMDEFIIDSELGRGTEITARKWI